MPRPKVDRVIRSVRLPADVDAALVAAAQKRRASINETLEFAVRSTFPPRVSR